MARLPCPPAPASGSISYTTASTRLLKSALKCAQPPEPMKKVLLLTLAVLPVATACATAPPPAPAVVPFEQKMAVILRLEDHRVLRDAPPAVVAAPASSGRKPQVAPVPPQVSDLTTYLADPEGRVRRRAALAIGRVG